MAKMKDRKNPKRDPTPEQEREWKESPENAPYFPPDPKKERE